MNPHLLQPSPLVPGTLQAREVRRVTFWGLVVNLALSLMKFVIGVLGRSQALVADAVHSLSDTVTDMAVLVGARYWTAPADAEHPHGHGRIETIITSVIGIALGGVGIGLGYRAILTLPEHHAGPPTWLAFAAACLSIVVKEALYRWTVYVGRRVRSSAVIANAWHHRSDAMSSVPVAVAVLGTHIHPAWGFLDHVATVVVSVLILHAAWTITWPALRQLVDAGAGQKERQRILALALDTEGVRAVHKLRTRHIGPGLQMDIHVLVDPDLTVAQGHAIAGVVKERVLQYGPEVVDVLVHVEPYGATHEEAGHAEAAPRDEG